MRVHASSFQIWSPTGVDRGMWCMTYSRRTTILVLSAVFSAALLVCDLPGVRVFAQAQLTYPEVITSLQSKLPNSVFRNKTQLTAWVIAQIRRRKMDKPLTKDREDDLRQAGATGELIEAIRENSPALPTPTPAPDPGPVDLGEIGRASCRGKGEIAGRAVADTRT